MPVEPSVPFYTVLSVYVPLVLVAYLGIFLGLSALAALGRSLVAVFRKKETDRVPAGGGSLGMAAGKA